MEKQAQYKKETKSRVIMVRVPDDLHAKLKKANLNIAAICRDALKKMVDG